MHTKLVIFLGCLSSFATSLTLTRLSRPKRHLHPEEKGHYFQGDMIIPDNLDNGYIDKDRHWPNGIVPVEIVGQFSSEELATLQNAFEEYHEKTCIKFHVKTPEDEDYLVINNNSTGCWSYVGRIGGAQLVNFETPDCLYSEGTVIHELMHALGFFHEQSRSDRDEYVDIQWDNIEKGEENNFHKFDESIINDYGVTYDYNSIMHYSDTAFTFNGKPTIVPKAEGVTIGNRNGLSEGDITKIKRMYNCE